MIILLSSVQASAQLSWAELALILFTLAPARPPTVQSSSEIVGYQVDLLSTRAGTIFNISNIWKTTLGRLLKSS